MAKDKLSFILYSDLIDVLEIMPDEKAGQLFKTILRYVNDKDPHPKDPLVNIAWQGIKSKLKRDLKAYEAKRQGQKKGAAVTNLKRYRPELYKKYKNGSITYEQVLESIDKENDDPKPLKIESKKPETTGPRAASSTKKEIKETWNVFFENTDVPKVKTITDQRQKKFNSIVKKYGVISTFETLKKAKSSTFINKSTFFTFDWFFNQTNFIKVSEGNYQDKKTTATKNVQNRAETIFKTISHE